MYRPEEWERMVVKGWCGLSNGKAGQVAIGSFSGGDRTLIEAGADALLKGLEKRGFKFYENGEFQIPIKTVTQ
ncbi:hypothetical protein LCGC14_2525630 [marine sediment metagenome]|uniref:Uncharacterized protein n=1 Tax=marine sediment metagenome TaxID=412755 RepID=A0A0F9AVI3_9ZZZZ